MKFALKWDNYINHFHSITKYCKNQMKQRFSGARWQTQHRQNVRDALTPKWDAITMQTLHDFDLNQMLERTGGPYQTMKNQHNKLFLVLSKIFFSNFELIDTTYILEVVALFVVFTRLLNYAPYCFHDRWSKGQGASFASKMFIFASIQRSTMDLHTMHLHTMISDASLDAVFLNSTSLQWSAFNIT